jgi:hypothetical protein
MRIETHGTNIVISPGLRRHAEMCVWRAVQRHRQRVSWVGVQLTEFSGPGEPHRTTCQIDVWLRKSGRSRSGIRTLIRTLRWIWRRRGWDTLSSASLVTAAASPASQWQQVWMCRQHRRQSHAQCDRPKAGTVLFEPENDADAPDSGSLP